MTIKRRSGPLASERSRGNIWLWLTAPDRAHVCEGVDSFGVDAERDGLWLLPLLLLLYSTGRETRCGRDTSEGRIDPSVQWRERIGLILSLACSLSLSLSLSRSLSPCPCLSLSLSLGALWVTSLWCDVIDPK